MPWENTSHQSATWWYYLFPSKLSLINLYSLSDSFFTLQNTSLLIRVWPACAVLFQVFIGFMSWIDSIWHWCFVNSVDVTCSHSRLVACRSRVDLVLLKCFNRCSDPSPWTHTVTHLIKRYTRIFSFMQPVTRHARANRYVWLYYSLLKLM